MRSTGWSASCAAHGYDGASLADAINGACEVPEKARAITGIFNEFLARRERFYGPDDCLLAAETDHAPWRRSSSSASGRRPPSWSARSPASAAHPP